MPNTELKTSINYPNFGAVVRSVSATIPGGVNLRLKGRSLGKQTVKKGSQREVIFMDSIREHRSIKCKGSSACTRIKPMGRTSRAQYIDMDIIIYIYKLGDKGGQDTRTRMKKLTKKQKQNPRSKQISKTKILCTFRVVTDNN